MRIGIDIDDTLTETKQEISKQIKKYRRIYKLKRYNEFHQLSDEDFKKFMVEFGEKIYLGMPLKKKAVRVIQEWKEQGHIIYFITARAENEVPNIEYYTKSYLRKYQIPYDGIVFGSQDKGLDCQRLQLDVFIDDRESVLDTIKGPFLIRMILDKKNYSKYHKVRNWKEIKEIVKTL